MRRLALAAALLAAACTTQQQAPPRGAPELGVEFTWAGVPPCSNVSPRIVVRDFPPATKRFRVELVDVDSAFGRHGTSDVEAPTGVIAAGALKSYRGPCPSQNAIVYEMRVQALDEGGRVIAQGAERSTYTPGDLRRRVRR
jgi:phosphatidylethanolamine-binding protein (PEBP) family uncharacterized protein